MRDAEFGGTDRRTGGYSIPDGISVKSPGERTLPVVKEHVARIEIVREDEIENAIHMLAEIEKKVVEGSGAVAIATVLSNRDAFTGKRTALIISGGNIDTRLLLSVLMRGLVRSGRLIRLGVRPDQRSARQSRRCHLPDRGAERQHRRGSARVLVPRYSGAACSNRGTFRGPQRKRRTHDRRRPRRQGIPGANSQNRLWSDLVGDRPRPDWRSHPCNTAEDGIRLPYRSSS